MAKIPEFLLKALYVKSSLRNENDGFVFQMKNDLGPARIIGARPLQLDRKPIPLDSCSFIHGEEEAGFADVDPENSVLMRKGEAVTVRVHGQKLRPGRRALGVNVVVKDIGNVSFTITDQVR
ncbi:MAG: hypothetical protein JSW55_15965 [Chloroflexota bacterium]|nr:MAG: hypothetical protein JSW55_15965 [Chloroflexota bacterium]